MDGESEMWQRDNAPLDLNCLNSAGSFRGSLFEKSCCAAEQCSNPQNFIANSSEVPEFTGKPEICQFQSSFEEMVKLFASWA